MKTRELTREQIEYLFEFTYRKRVRYYDVQVEIVDHLASAIEEKWRQQPDLPFETALEQIYQSFGVFGFARIVQAKEKAVARLSRRELSGFFRVLVQPRHAWVPLGMFLLFYYLFASVDLERFITILPLLAMGSLLLIVGLIAYFVLRKYRRPTGKKFLLSELPVSMVAAAGGGFHGLFLFVPRLLSELMPGGLWLASGLAVFYTLWFLLLYAGFFHLPRRAEELIRQRGYGLGGV